MPSTLLSWAFTARPTPTSWPARKRKVGRSSADLDYPRLLALARSTDPSLILFRDGDWSEADVLTRMGDVLQALTEADIAQSIIVVDRDRVRRRRLPIEQ